MSKRDIATIFFNSDEVMSINAELGLTMDQLVRLHNAFRTAESAQAVTAWGSPDGFWIRAEDKSRRPDAEKFNIPFYTAE